MRRPKRLAVNDSPEFISKASGSWANRNGVVLEFLRLGKRNDIAFVKSLIGHFREKSLDQHSFETLAEAREMIEAGRVEYNYERPHGALGQQTPATFVVEWVPL